MLAAETSLCKGIILQFKKIIRCIQAFLFTTDFFTLVTDK